MSKAWLQTNDPLDTKAFEAALAKVNIGFVAVQGQSRPTYEIEEGDDYTEACKLLSENYQYTFEVNANADAIEQEALTAGCVFARNGSVFTVLRKSVETFTPILLRERDLQKAKEKRLLAIKAKLDAALFASYPIADQISLTNMFFGAVAEGKTNRADYLKQVMTWGQELYGFFETTKAAIVAANTLDAIEGVDVDLSDWNSRKPEVTFGGASSISD